MKEVIIKSKIVGKESAIGSGKPIAFPDLSAYALRSDFIRLESSFNDFLEGDDTDNVINRWKELEAFLNNISEDYNLLSLLNGKADKATTLSGYGITDAYTKTNVDDLLKSYVTLSGSQTITGEKNFVGGLKVNGSPIYYDSAKKYWKLEGDLLVTGGVTMYGSDSSFTPSTIMDALLYDDTTLGINSNGQLYVKGGAGGEGLDITALQNYLTQNSYLNVTEGDGRYLKLSGGSINSGDDPIPLTLSNTASTLRIAFRRNNEQLGYLGFIEANKPLFYDTDGNGRLLLHERNYSSYALPLTGGTLTLPNHVGLVIKRTNVNSPVIAFYNNDELEHNYIGFEGNRPIIMNKVGVASTIWHSGNDGSGSGLDADLLDGKHNGELTAIMLLSVGGYVLDANEIKFSDYALRFFSGIPDTSTNFPTITGYQNGLLALPIHSNGATAQLYFTIGKNPYYRSHHTYGWNELAYKTDNVASATKLQTARTIWGHNFDGTENVFGQLYLNASKIVWHDDANNYYIGCPTVTGGAMLEYKAYSGHAFLGGNVGIGTASPQQKLHVEGHIWANGDIAAKTKIQSFGNLIVNGNVGIGTENPTGKLSVNGTVYLTEGTVDNYSYIRSSNYTNNTARLIIGTCYGYKTEVNALSIYNGQVGIGTTMPTTKFDINGKSMEVGTSVYGSGGVGSEIYMSTHREGRTLCARGMRMYVSGSATGYFQSFAIDAKNYGTLTNIMSIDSSGNLLVVGGITMYSDQRKKTILNHVELSLKQIAEAPLIEHYYNGDDKKTTHVGSIAQYWASLNDWFCKLDSEGYYTMEIQNAALASAISIARELDRYETKTDKAIKKLKKRICELEEEVERLKSA